MNAITYRAFQGELEKIAAFEKLSEMEKEAIRRALRKFLGRGAGWVGKQIDERKAKKYLEAGNTEMALYHGNTKPTARIMKVLGRDPASLLPAAAVEATSWVLLPGIPLAHQPTLLTAALGRKLRGKPTYGEMMQRMKDHPKFGIGAI
jgi:hypothetical protein